MRLLLIRHGDPDYIHDTLTEKGEKEAELLADMISRQQHIDSIYVSPLGRARKTASYTEEKIRKRAIVENWLQEFPGILDINDSQNLQRAYSDTPKKPDGTYRNRIFWDMLPSAWSTQPEYLDNQGWRESEIGRTSGLNDLYDSVTGSLDRLLADYGYERDGKIYHVCEANTKTVALFCHFGVSCVLLSHIWNVSPFILWHCLGMQPSSLTELVTEERQEGTASFRCLRVGDISHLCESGEKPSFMGRFCETYANKEQRH